MSAKKPLPYTLPPGPLLKPIIICGVVMALSANKRIASPGSPLYDNILSRSSIALKAFVWAQRGIFWFLYGAHTIESLIFIKKLNEQGVSVFSTAWWKWMVECFIGGKFCFEHFEGAVKARSA